MRLVNQVVACTFTLIVVFLFCFANFSGFAKHEIQCLSVKHTGDCCSSCGFTRDIKQLLSSGDTRTLINDKSIPFLLYLLVVLLFSSVSFFSRSLILNRAISITLVLMTCVMGLYLNSIS